MLILMIILALVLILDITAWFWGIDSTDKIDSSEWQRRRRSEETRRVRAY